MSRKNNINFQNTKSISMISILKFSNNASKTCGIFMYCSFNSYFTFNSKEKLRLSLTAVFTVT